MLVLLTYRPNYEKYCPRGCHREGGNDSKFEITSHDTEESLIDKVIKDRKEDDDADFNHIVVTDFGGLNMAVNSDFSGIDDEYSIQVFFDEYSEDFDTKYKEKEDLENRLRTMYKVKRRAK